MCARAASIHRQVCLAFFCLGTKAFLLQNAGAFPNSNVIPLFGGRMPQLISSISIPCARFVRAAACHQNRNREPEHNKLKISRKFITTEGLVCLPRTRMEKKVV